MSEQEKAEKQKFEEFYRDHYPDDYEEEEHISCPDGYFEEDWCDPETRRGIEYCEFLCPFHRVNDASQIVLRKETEKPT